MTLKDTTKCLGYAQITTLTTAQALKPPVGALLAMIQCEGQPVRWRDDGTAPTASVGMRLLVGQTLEYDGDLTRIAAIEEAASAKLNVTFYS